MTEQPTGSTRLRSSRQQTKLVGESSSGATIEERVSWTECVAERKTTSRSVGSEIDLSPCAAAMGVSPTPTAGNASRMRDLSCSYFGQLRAQRLK